jgi:hypothetical protein
MIADEAKGLDVKVPVQRNWDVVRKGGHVSNSSSGRATTEFGIEFVSKARAVTTD